MTQESVEEWGAPPARPATGPQAEPTLRLEVEPEAEPVIRPETEPAGAAAAAVPDAPPGPAPAVTERLDRLADTVTELHGGLTGTVAALRDELTDALSSLRQEAAGGNERAAARERVIDRQHEEIERLRAGERQALLRPMLVELRRLRDDLLRQAGGLPEQLPVSQMVDLLESFAFSVELILSRAGVETIRPAVGSPFDPGRQRAAGVVPAPSPELDGTVAEVVTDGYLDLTTDRVLATATVRVRRWQEPAPPADHESAETARPTPDTEGPVTDPVDAAN